MFFIADTHNHIPAVMMICLTQKPLFPTIVGHPLDLAKNRTFIQCTQLEETTCAGNLDIMELIIVAGVDANVVLATIAPAPASAVLVAKCSIAFEAFEMIDEAVVVVSTAVSAARSTTDNVELLVF